MAAMQKQIDDATQATVAAETTLADLKKQLETATQRRTESAKAQKTAERAVTATDRALTAAVEAHSRAFAKLARNPADAAGKQAAVDLAAKMQAQRVAADVRRVELAAITAAIAAADTQIEMLTPQRDQSKAAVDQSAATLATLGPALEPLKQAAAAADAKATELTAQLEAARADLAHWQDETAFLGRYRELAGVVAAREAAVREAEAKVAEGQAKVAADELARQTLVNERQAKEKEISALTAAVAKAQQDHAALLQKVAAKQMEMTAAQASMDQLGKAVGALEAAAVSTKSAVDAAPADQELAGVHATLVKTVAAKATQIKAIGESQAAMAAEKAAREKEAADMTARAEKLKADMPAVTARMQELDGMITQAATVVESSAAAVRSLEPPVAERQKEVDAAVGQLSALQGLPPGT
jgi:chromosome segregation ATPase